VNGAETEASDEALMLRYVKGDQRAFAILVRRYERQLFTFALRFLRGRETAREVTQEAFLRVVRRCHEFRQEARFSTWIFAILRNLCIDELRKARHRNHPSLDADRGDSSGSLLDHIPASGPDLNPERAAAKAALGRDLDEALASLPAEQLEVFLMREVGGLPFREIALATDTPENTVKSRMRYALERLQQALGAHEAEAKALR